jgi:hypothetical protein
MTTERFRRLTGEIAEKVIDKESRITFDQEVDPRDLEDDDDSDYEDWDGIGRLM